MAATLDIRELQVLIHYAADPNVGWHHRVLLVRTGDAWWIVLSSDFEYDWISTLCHVRYRSSDWMSPFRVHCTLAEDTILGD